MKMCCGKDYEVKLLDRTFPQQPVKELIDILKGKHKTAEKCHTCFTELNRPGNKKVWDHCH